MLVMRFKFSKTVLLFLFCSGISFSVDGQINVGLDNFYNNERNSSGKPFHYLWTDSALSGYSEWGRIFLDQGATLTTVSLPEKGVLKKLDVYIIVDPDSTSENQDPSYILDGEVSLIVNWVRSGGVLVLLANDAPNCEFTHLNRLAGRFGLFFNHVTLMPVTGTNYEMGAINNLPEHLLFKGVNKVYFKDVSSLTLSGNSKEILSKGGSVLIAESRFGKGLVVAVGDPWIYNEYIDHLRLPDDFDNYKAAENLTEYLLNHTGGV